MPQHPKKGFTLIELMTVIFILSVIIMIMIPNIRRAFWRARLTGCQSNLRNLATVLHSYAVDHEQYPERLSQIVPKYLGAMPSCPAAEADTYTDGYEWNDDPDAFTIHCSGSNHTPIGLGENEPYYSSIIGLGP